MLEQIIHRIDVEQIVRFMAVFPWIERIGIVWIGGNLQIGAVNSQKSKPMIHLIFINLFCEVPEKKFKCFRKDFGSLLNKGKENFLLPVQSLPGLIEKSHL